MTPRRISSRRSSICVAAIFGLLVLSACTTKSRVRQETTIGNEVMQVVMPAGKDVIHPQHGKEEWFAVGAMSGKDTTKANGVAQSHVFADGATIATVNLNIHEAPKGSHFVAWLEKPGVQKRVRLDILQNPFKDVRHVITADIDQDLRDYTSVVVTQEGAAGPMQTDPVVATGVLKHQKR